MSTGLRSDGVKRLFDLLVASSALIVLSPFIVALAVILRFTQGSPVIFRQQRPGMSGRPFIIYKFRTMVDAVDSDNESDVQRTTRLGHKLRALSLDELPELWNVIRGDMSLVGPRPLMMAYLPRYSTEQARRHEVRPGITGLAQINGRNALTWDEKFALDVKYVDEHDLRMDLDILMRTVTTVLSREGVNSSSDETMPEFMGSDTGSTS